MRSRSCRYLLQAIAVTVLSVQPFGDVTRSWAATPGLGVGYVVNIETIRLGGTRGFGVVQEIPTGFSDVVSAAKKTHLPARERYDALLKTIDGKLKLESDSLLTFKKGILLYMKGDYDQAHSTLEALIPRTPDKAIREEAAFHLGLISYKQKRYEDSVFFFKDCLWYNPNRTNAHVNLGIALFHLNKKEEA